MLASQDKSSGITLTISSNAEQVSLLSEALHALCLYATSSEKCALDVQLAVVEALNNVVIHAYHNQPEHEVTLRWYQENRQLRIEIIDSGVSMTFLPEPVLPDFEAEGSRGWWIINACVDEYFYQVVESVDKEVVLRPGDKNANVLISQAKSHSNILTMLKQF